MSMVMRGLITVTSFLSTTLRGLRILVCAPDVNNEYDWLAGSALLGGAVGVLGSSQVTQLQEILC